MKTIIPSFLLLFLTLCSYAQTGTLVENKALQFSIPQGQDTIEFVVVDTTLTETKPLFLWCQGSLPTPLFVEIEGYGYYFLGGGIINFNYASIVEDYHLVVISMPQTPVLAPKEHLNNQFQYVPDPAQPYQFLDAYVQADYLDHYVQRAQQVLHFLKQQTWVDAQKLVVAGHSQGAKIATKVAVQDPSVTHLGLFGANPFGRIDQYVRDARLQAQLGKISWEKADSLMNDSYAFYQKAVNEDSIAAQPQLKAWKTFSETYYDDWLQLDIPIYLAYGTEDRVADLCDLMPLFFIEKNKQNLTLKRYLGLEHNFFEVHENGQPDHKKGHWKDVMQAFMNWIED